MSILFDDNIVSLHIVASISFQLSLFVIRHFCILHNSRNVACAPFYVAEASLGPSNNAIHTLNQMSPPPSSQPARTSAWTTDSSDHPIASLLLGRPCGSVIRVSRLADLRSGYSRLRWSSSPQAHGCGCGCLGFSCPNEKLRPNAGGSGSLLNEGLKEM